jgi:hypothetical protein
MVGDTPVLDMSYVAGQDLSNSQFRCVSMGNDGNMYLSSTSVQTIGSVTVPTQVWGILQNDPPSGDIAVVRELGHSKCVMSGTPAPGNGLKLADTAGRLTTGTVGSDVIVAFMSQDTCGGTGEIHDVALMARCAQGASFRAGQLTYLVPMVALGTSGATNVIALAPLGFTGTIVDMYAVVNKVASSSGAGPITLEITATPVGSLALPVSNANAKTLSQLISSTGKASISANSFGPTDTLTIISTPTTTWATDSGMLEIHVITN